MANPAYLNINESAVAFSDQQMTSNPKRRFFDWTRNNNGILVNNPKSEQFYDSSSHLSPSLQWYAGDHHRRYDCLERKLHGRVEIPFYVGGWPGSGARNRYSHYLR